MAAEANKLTSASARRIYDKRGVQLKLCATPSTHSSMATFPSLIVYVGVAYLRALMGGQHDGGNWATVNWATEKWASNS